MALPASKEPHDTPPLGFRLAPPTAPITWDEDAATHALYLRAEHQLDERDYSTFVLACERRARFWRGRLAGPVSPIARFPRLNPRRKHVRVTLGDVARTAFLYEGEWRRSSAARISALLDAQMWAQVESGGPVGRLLPLVPDEWEVW